MHMLSTMGDEERATQELPEELRAEVRYRPRSPRALSSPRSTRAHYPPPCAAAAEDVSVTPLQPTCPRALPRLDGGGDERGEGSASDGAESAPVDDEQVRCAAPAHHSRPACRSMFQGVMDHAPLERVSLPGGRKRPHISPPLGGAVMGLV